MKKLIYVISWFLFVWHIEKVQSREDEDKFNNGCLSCYLVFEDCRGSSSTVLANAHDSSLIIPADPKDNKTMCVPHGKKLSGPVDDFICFPEPKCEVVVNFNKHPMIILSLTPEEIEICEKCRVHCGCKKVEPITFKPELPDIFKNAAIALNGKFLFWITLILLHIY